MTKDSKIGFVGTGIMGQSMAANIQKEGYQLYVFNRTKSKAQSLLDQGACWCDTPGDVASKADIVFSIVSFPQDVRSIYLEANGILEKARNNSIVCDMSTSEPSLAIEIAKEAEKKDIISMDAPVSGGDIGAKNGTLAIMVGGSKDGFEKLLPLFEAMGKTIVHMGTAGAGQHTKMCNQTAIAGIMMGVCEAMRYAKQAGIDLNKLLEAISGGGAGSWTLDNLAPRIVKGDFAPGFIIEHYVKDMKIACQEAEKLKVNAPVLQKTLEYYQRVVESGAGHLGTHGLYKLWDENPDW